MKIASTPAIDVVKVFDLGRLHEKTVADIYHLCSTLFRGHPIRCGCPRCRGWGCALKDMCHVRAEARDMTPEEAQRELALRLLFEVAFGFLTFRDLSDGLWLEPRTQRDHGHQQRLENVWRTARRCPLAYLWITWPVASRSPVVYEVFALASTFKASMRDGALSLRPLCK